MVKLRVEGFKTSLTLPARSPAPEASPLPPFGLPPLSIGDGEGDKSHIYNDITQTNFPFPHTLF